MPSPLSDRAFRILPVQIGKYTLLTRLASGGMGEVYVARMSAAAGFEKQVVIKRLLPELARDQQFVQLFLQEARLTARLSHPNICQVFELTAIDDDYLLVMEYLEGFPLSTMIRSYADRGLDLRIATGLVTQACEGLQYAHDFRDDDQGVHGIVHRDVSPHNLMLTVSGVVKLLDFGVAKLRREGHHTVTGSAKGKYAYMAPEQLHCEDLDARADLFAAGVVLFELITGKRLFKRRSELATMQAIVEGERPNLHEMRSEVPRDLSDIVHRVVAVDREQRPTSARELADAIRAAMVPLGGPASLGELSEYVREHHAAELDEQRMLIRVATGKIPRVKLDEDGNVVLIEEEAGDAGASASGASDASAQSGRDDDDDDHERAATTIQPISRGRATSEQSGKAIRSRLPLRAPTVTRGVDAILDGFEDEVEDDSESGLENGYDSGFEYDDATVLDEKAVANAPPRRLASQSRPASGADIGPGEAGEEVAGGFEGDGGDGADAVDIGESIEIEVGLLDEPVPVAESTRPSSIGEQTLDVDLRRKRRGAWMPLAGLLIAVAVMLFFWQRSGSTSKPGSDTPAVAAAATAEPGQKAGTADGPTGAAGDRADRTGQKQDDGNESIAGGANDHVGDRPDAGPDAGPADLSSASADGQALDAGAEASASKSRRDRRRKRRRDRDKKNSASKGFGHLTVDASPYAEIFIDGKKMGITPLVRVKLSAGQHKIKAVSARGAKRVRVTIDKGKTTKKRIVF